MKLATALVPGLGLKTAGVFDIVRPAVTAGDQVMDDLAGPGRNLRVEAVVHPLSLPAMPDDAAIFEDGQMLGHLRLGYVESRDDLTDAEFTQMVQQGDDSEPGHIRQAAGQLMRFQDHDCDCICQIADIPPDPCGTGRCIEVHRTGRC